MTQATKFGHIDWAVTPLFPEVLNKVNDPFIPYFHYFFHIFHYCSCLISVLVSLQNYSSFFVVWLLPKTLVVTPSWMIAIHSLE